MVAMPGLCGAGDELGEPSGATRSGARFSCGSTVTDFPEDVSHRNSMC
jgi:hypothetical protein